MRQFASFVCFVILQSLLFLQCAEATHFRYGTYRWTRDPAVTGDSTGKTVIATVEQAYRMSYYGTLSVGQKQDITQDPYGDSERWWIWGDGTQSQVLLTVSSVNGASDWFVGTQTIKHTYTVAKRYLVYFQQCCRISSLMDGNNDRNARLEFSVDLTSGKPLYSVAATGLPIIPFTQSVTTTVRIPTTPSDNKQAVTFSFTKTGDGNAGSNGAAGDSGLYTQKPSGLTMQSDGTITWTPSTVGLFGIQVLFVCLLSFRVRLLSSPNRLSHIGPCFQVTMSDGVNYIVLDVILSVAKYSAAKPPFFVPDPSPPKNFFLGSEVSTIAICSFHHYTRELTWMLWLWQCSWSLMW